MVAIAIDGPSGAGKSTLSKAAAEILGYIYVDTGACYRALGHYAINSGVNPKDREKVVELLSGITLELKYKDGEQMVLVNGKDVSKEIRSPEMSAAASTVSAIPEVREWLLETQRELARINNVIMDGRDIGTVILPNADVKIFLTATPEDRAKRRYEEYLAKGVKVEYNKLLEDMKERDKNDSSRASAPLKPADDAILLDSTGFEFGQTLEKILEIIKGV